MANRWLTPAGEPPGTYYSRRLLIPQDVDWIAIVSGALAELLKPWNFEQDTGISPDDTAAAFSLMFDGYNTEDWAMIGVIIPYATTNPPVNTLSCDGASHLRADYPLLYAALVSAYHTDADHFTTPDLRGRSLVGAGQGSGLTNRAVAASGGNETHQLSSGEMPAHVHSGAFTAGPIAFTVGPAPAFVLNVPVNTGSTGGGGAHNNMQPWLALNYCIIAK